VWHLQPVAVARGVFVRALREMGAGLSDSEAATLFADLARSAIPTALKSRACMRMHSSDERAERR
jgi:hypothetical protein